MGDAVPMPDAVPSLGDPSTWDGLNASTSNPPYYDVMNFNFQPNTDDGKGKSQFNIDYVGPDPLKPYDWSQAPIAFNLPKTTDEPVTCEATCREMSAEREKRCELLRKRVAVALKQAGCPSIIKGYKKPKSSCAKRASTKKTKKR